ncbi:MAG: hypothetical protein ACI809_001385, partial [Candidatus Azotimanducaceae bacterium]
FQTEARNPYPIRYVFGTDRPVVVNFDDMRG